MVTISGKAQMSQLWGVAYDGTGSGQDHAVAIAADKWLNTYVAGTSVETGTGVDIVIVKYSPFGAQVWRQPITAVSNYSDEAVAIAVDDHGDVYVTGDSRYGGGGSQVEIRTAKLQGSDGDFLYNETYRYQNEETHVSDMAINKDGHVFLTGWSGTTSGRMITLRLDENGDMVTGWPQRHDDALVGTAIAVGPSDNVYVTGQILRSGTDIDWITIRYTGAGSQQWERYTHGSGEPVEKDDAPTDIAVDSQNNVFVCGYVFNTNTSADTGAVSFNVNGVDRWNVPGHRHAAHVHIGIEWRLRRCKSARP
jgi:hypothetical protein